MQSHSVVRYKIFRLYDWVTQVEGKKGGKLREWGIEPGQRPDIEMYKEVNQRFQEQTLESLRELAKGDKPFFLNYWPQIPVAVLRSTDDSKCLTPNCGRWAEAMSVVDGYIGVRSLYWNRSSRNRLRISDIQRFLVIWSTRIMGL